MYTKESLAKAVKLMKAAKQEYESKSAADIKICISKGNVKIGRVMNVSLPQL